MVLPHRFRGKESDSICFRDVVERSHEVWEQKVETAFWRSVVHTTGLPSALWNPSGYYNGRRYCMRTRGVATSPVGTVPRFEDAHAPDEWWVDNREKLGWGQRPTQSCLAALKESKLRLSRSSSVNPPFLLAQLLCHFSHFHRPGELLATSGNKCPCFLAFWIDTPKSIKLVLRVNRDCPTRRYLL